jgi:hypothetical protein
MVSFLEFCVYRKGGWLMQCKDCGAAYDAGDNFCRNCGSSITSAAPPVEQHNPPVATVDTAASTKPIKHKNWLKAISVAIILFSLMTVVLVHVAPDLLKAGGFTPKDLGVQWSDADYKSILEKTKVLSDTPPESMDRSAFTDVYTGKKNIDWTLIDSEITAWMNTEAQPGYWPFSNVQFKIHPDNVMEASLSIDPKKLMTFPIVTKYLPQEIKGFLSRIPLQIPAYAKVKVHFTGPKQVEVHMEDFQASGVSVADFAVSDQANQVIASMLNDMFGHIDQVDITSFTTSEGSLNIKGTWYEEIKRTPVE